MSSGVRFNNPRRGGGGGGDAAGGEGREGGKKLADPGMPPSKDPYSRGSGHTTDDDESKEVKVHYLEPDKLNDIPEWLIPTHLVAGLFHYLQTFILFSMTANEVNRWPVYTNFPSKNDLNPDVYGNPISQQTGSTSLTLLSALFMVLAALYHTAAVVPCTRPRYEHFLVRNRSPYRWLEMSVSGGLMKMVIGQIAGISDAHVLFCIFVLTNCGILFASFHEPLNSRARASSIMATNIRLAGGKVNKDDTKAKDVVVYNQNFLGLYISFVPLIVTWFIIFAYYTKTAAVETPTYVGTTIVVLLMLDIVFVLIFALQWYQINVFKDYVMGEFCFILLNFTAKTFLAWLAYGAASIKIKE